MSDLSLQPLAGEPPTRSPRIFEFSRRMRKLINGLKRECITMLIRNEIH